VINPPLLRDKADIAQLGKLLQLAGKIRFQDFQIGRLRSGQIGQQPPAHRSLSEGIDLQGGLQIPV
jgi:hypothetical protein